MNSLLDALLAYGKVGVHRRKNRRGSKTPGKINEKPENDECQQ